ncbi:probable bifunctional dTTP/UTP pyrophosphatase/methyltransferase protein isoform X2 [Lampris incognitus]|uniref:probable bifunctional dTTP/UTP pyrophosphatase/methyltransferase protein isoform X2 n=1 Tax=Lampris incognitus TaxID=2546036 RepID=UPI0024B4C71A|nr:probable bifunctional dTTP/UTP pyrophosphatase/methyltransferase protein isoform X2 [Lampris incognitus]
MLNPVISKLAGKLVVLASASPRRLEILRNVGLRFEVVPSWFKETLDKRLFKAPYEYAVETAKQKALEVAKRMPCKHLKTPDIVIGADTIVTVDGLILEKPVDKHDAYEMLSRLSGKEHSVFTGVAIVLCHEKENQEIDYQMIDFYEETKVKFADLSEDMLWEYINSGEPMDKAGGYGIQALGGMLVESVHGDFLNVVGFPLNHFCKQLDFIYNHLPSSMDPEKDSGSPSHNGTHTAPTLTDPPASLTNQSNHSPAASCSANRSSPASPRPSCPPAKHTHHKSLDNHTHKVKRKGDESGVGNCSWTDINSLSKQSDGKETGLQIFDNTTTPLANELKARETGASVDDDEDLKAVVKLMDGFKASKALFVASKLHVFDLLHSRAGRDAAEMAQEMKASVRGTERLLDACLSLGLLRRQERAHQTPTYENTRLAWRFLRSEAPESLQGYIQHCNETLWPLFSHLEKAVMEGTSQHEKAFGNKSNNLFQDAYYNRHEVKLRFMNAMHGIARVTGKAVATAFDLSRFQSACDLGGCTGAIAHELTKAHPGLSVTVFDLLEVVEMSGHFRPPDADDRVSFVAGDFFIDELPKADLYILARILHDWSDEKVHSLLSKISDACAPGCAVLIAEALLDGVPPYPALQSLNMLVQTEGTERTRCQYTDLLRKAGFGDVRVALTMNFLDVVIGIKM